MNCAPNKTTVAMGGCVMCGSRLQSTRGCAGGWVGGWVGGMERWVGGRDGKVGGWGGKVGG